MFVVLVFFSAIPAVAGSHGDLASGKSGVAPQTGIPQEDDTENFEQLTPNGNGQTIKLIPDQKAFFGSPDTLIDLSKVFSKTEIFAEGAELNMEVLRSKKDVAEAEIDGNVLRLKWGERTAKKREILIRATNSAGA